MTLTFTPTRMMMIHVTAITPHEWPTSSSSTPRPISISIFPVLLCLLITCFLIIPPSTATFSNHTASTCPIGHTTTTWHPISTSDESSSQQQSQSHDPTATRYMIMFDTYASQTVHASHITSHLTTPYIHLPRDNAASHYPTDFIVAMLNPSQVDAIRRIKGVKYVVVDKAIRSLLSVEEEDETTSDRGDMTGEDHGDPSLYTAPFDIPRRFSSHNAFIHGDEEYHQDQHMDQIFTQTHARKLCQLAGTDSITEKLGASTLWAAGHTGKHVSIAIFDTGLSTVHPHFKKIKDRTNWTDEKTLEDGLGHGTFVAGVIASMKECLGFAPDADLHIFRVFTQRQLSYTSWFMDAFNHAIHTHVDVLNLSIGGPDFMDRPFVDKVLEMSANHIIVVSAIGNDGPLYGTLNNPADQMDVIGVGGIDGDDRIARFSSRGMTTWELPEGYGRVKPDIVTYGKGIRGSKLTSGCRSLSGTSVASPVVAGAVVALVSVIPKDQRTSIINPASMKQLLTETAIRIPDANIFEQGMGKLNLEGAYRLLTSGFQPHASMIPPNLDLTDCPYMWPYCTQDLYHSAIPTIINATILNSISVSSSLQESPRWIPADVASDILDIQFTYPNVIWPWSGWLGIHIRVKHPVKERIIVTGTIKLTLVCDYGVLTSIEAPLRVAVIPTPPRAQRILWDQFHNLRYPSGYFPRDNLDVTSDILDWNGDHPHTNFRDIFIWLRSHNYYLEILGRDFTCFDATLYGALLMVDPEEEYFDAEVTKLHHDIMEKGLSLILFADWYNIQRMREVKFFDENTARWWMPETGGSNLPAINELLSPYGIAWGDQIYRGTVNIGGEDIAYASGTSLLRFPADSYLLSSFLSDSTTEESSRTATRSLVPILGAWHANTSSSGHIIVYGDSNCLDSNHRDRDACTGLLSHMITYATTGILNDAIKNMAQHMIRPYQADAPVRQPERMVGNGLARYSRVISSGAMPQCLPRISSDGIYVASDDAYTDSEVDPIRARSRAAGSPHMSPYTPRTEADDVDSLHSRMPTVSPASITNTSSYLYSFDTSSTDYSSMIIFIILLILICGIAIAARQIWISGVVGNIPSSRRKLVAPGSGRRSASMRMGMEP